MSPECVGVALIASFLRQGVQGFSWHMENCKLVSSRWVFLSQPEVSLSPAPSRTAGCWSFSLKSQSWWLP